MLIFSGASVSIFLPDNLLEQQFLGKLI